MENEERFRRALEAIIARVDGEFDNPALVAFGPLMDTESDVRDLANRALYPEGDE